MSAKVQTDTFETLEGTPSELEEMLRADPELAKAFFLKCTRKDEFFSWEALTPEERGIAVRAYLDSGSEINEVARALLDVDYIRQPVHVEEFLEDPQYLGEFSKEIYAPWRRDLTYVLDPKNQIFEWCFSGDTKVRTPFEGTLTIKELAERGKEDFWVYSWGPGNDIWPARACQARKTREQQKLVRVKLSNGRVIKCTPDHEFILLGSKKKKARYLTPKDKLAAFNLKCRVVSVEPIDKPEDVYCLTVPGFNNFALDADVFVSNCIGGSVGSGKTSAAIISQLYKLYSLTCLRNIPSHFSLSTTTKISFGFFTVTMQKGDDALSDTFKNLIAGSPYFRNIFPLKKIKRMRKVMNTAGAKEDDYEVLLPNGLQVLIGSKTQHALSLALVSGILDEMNFRNRRTIKTEDNEDSAEGLYEEIRSRITSRFHRMGNVPGLLCVISSKKTQSDFLEAHIAKVKNDPHTHISSYSQWDVKPARFSKERFKVFIGASKTSSRILDEDEAKEFPEGHPQILEVPTSLKREFEHDINVSLRQLGGITSAPSYLLFDNPLILLKGWDKSRESVFVEDELFIGIQPKNRHSIKSFLKPQSLLRDAGFAIVPRHYPGIPRAIHIDLAVTKDSAGICMGCVPYVKESRGRDHLGNSTVKSLNPYFWIDFNFTIRAPQGDQINFLEIQKFINYLSSCGFRIDYITYDKFQSVGSTQMLTMDGFFVGYVGDAQLSVSYQLVKDAFAEKSISAYKTKILERELLNLKIDISANKARVDHPKLNTDGTTGCFTGDTKVKLLDGRSRSFKELVDEFGPTKPFYVYTIRDGRVSVGVARNPRITKRVSSILKVILDTGETIRCTPDHLFMLRDGTYKPASELTPKESLMPLYTQISDGDMKGYEMYWEPHRCKNRRGWKYTHRMVGKWKYFGNGYTGNQHGKGLIHHDKGKLNNDPDSLIWFATNTEHLQRHRLDIMKKRANPDFEAKRIAGLKAHNDKPEVRKAQAERMRDTISRPEFRVWQLENARQLGKRTGPVNITKYNKSEAHRRKASEMGKKTIWKAIAAIPRVDAKLTDLIKLRKNGLSNSGIAKLYACSISYIERSFTQARRQGHDVPKSRYIPKGRSSIYTFTAKDVAKLRDNGMTWKEIGAHFGCHKNVAWGRLNARNNHKVVSTRLVQKIEDVYDLTVDETHNFALASGVFVHNSKDAADGLSGVLNDLYEMLTNSEKFPNTANIDMASMAIADAFPRSDPKDIVEPGATWVTSNEDDALDEYTRSLIPTYRRRPKDGE